MRQAIHQISLHAKDKARYEQIVSLAPDLSATLRMNGQICSREWPLQNMENGVQATVLAPERDAFAPALHGVYVRKCLQQVQDAGIAVNFHAVGEDSCGAPLCACADASAYLLHTTFVSLEAPLRCPPVWP
ncbi:DUF2310 family Zn-ribbon-containing protein [Massilia sp. W12]|uniref:DUF2310 family Zn-ribbon-containing protein n=1 Tax=Massilia sp. W12 TaxID=3126507 RepID=UPI0030CB9D2B